MRKIAVFLMVSLLLCGCSQTPDTGKEMLSTSIIQATVLDRDNNELGTIQYNGILLNTKNEIVYYKLYQKESNGYSKCEYYRFDLNTGKSNLVGTVADWAHHSKDVAYVDGNIYFLAYRGEVLSDEPLSMDFIKIDLKNSTTTVIYSDNDSWMHNTLARFGDKIIIAQSETGGCQIVEYDTVKASKKTVKKFNFDNNSSTGESVRKIYSDGKSLWLLVLKSISSTEKELRIEEYDKNMQLLSAKDVSAISQESNERIQGVEYFKVAGDYIFYENFSATRYFGVFDDKDLKSCADVSIKISMARESSVTEKTILYEKYNKESNMVYLVDCVSGECLQTNFNKCGDSYQISRVCFGENGALLIDTLLKTSKINETAHKLYCLDTSDLEFVDYDHTHQENFKLYDME